MVWTAIWALIDDLDSIQINTTQSQIIRLEKLTIATILFPLGPVTLTHSPQWADPSQLEDDRAVP